MTALKMAKHQHMTAYASQGHTRYLSTPPSFMQFKTYHYYPVKHVDATKLVEPQFDNSHLLQSTLMQSVVFYFQDVHFS